MAMALRQQPSRITHAALRAARAIAPARAAHACVVMAKGGGGGGHSGKGGGTPMTKEDASRIQSSQVWASPQTGRSRMAGPG